MTFKEYLNEDNKFKAFKDFRKGPSFLCSPLSITENAFYTEHIATVTNFSSEDWNRILNYLPKRTTSSCHRVVYVHWKDDIDILIRSPRPQLTSHKDSDKETWNIFYAPRYGEIDIEESKQKVISRLLALDPNMPIKSF